MDKKTKARRPVRKQAGTLNWKDLLAPGIFISDVRLALAKMPKKQREYAIEKLAEFLADRVTPLVMARLDGDDFVSRVKQRFELGDTKKLQPSA